MKRIYLTLLCLLFFVPASPLLGQTRTGGTEFTLKEMLSLQQRTRKLSQIGIPKTVLVRSLLSKGRVNQGAGTGAIISEDGYILTCAHVVGPATRVEVVFHDRTILEAEKLGWNEKNDYCLLKVKTKEKLPYFELGNSDELEFGDWVMALGHPGGPNVDREASCSLGRITQLHAKLPAQYYKRYYGNAIKSDTPIFSGNSGGPLVNMSGELIGLNAAILLYNEDSFTVPINEIKEVLPLLKNGENLIGYGPNEYPSALRKRLPSSRNGFLGVKTKTVPVDVKEILEIAGGALVEEVLVGSAADKAGLQQYDIILFVDKKSIRDPYQLTSTIQSYKPFTPATFKVMRRGEIISVRVVIGRQ